MLNYRVFEFELHPREPETHLQYTSFWLANILMQKKRRERERERERRKSLVLE